MAPAVHTRPAPARRRTALIALAFASTCCARTAGAAPGENDSPSVTPYRPTVSTPAQLSAPGYLELEAGWLGLQRHAAERRDSVPYSLKFAFSDDWGVRVDGEAFVSVPDGSGGRTGGFGDTVFVLKRRFAIDDARAFGLEAKVGPSTARPELASGSGATDYSVVGIYSADFARAWHTDVNLAALRLGEVDPGENRTQVQGAAAVSRTVDERWTVVGELYGSRQHGAEDHAQWLIGSSYQPARSLVLDLGFAHGMTAATPRWSLFAGFTTFVRPF